MMACRCATIAAVFPDVSVFASARIRSSVAAVSCGAQLRPRHALRALGGAAPGAAAEHQRFGDGVAGKPIGAVGAADHFAGDVEAGHVGRHAGVGLDAAHVIMRDRRHLDRHAGEIDVVCGEAIDHRAERRAQRRRRAMLEGQIRAAVRRAAAGLDFLEDGVGGEIAGQHVFAVFVGAVARGEFLHAAVEQPAAELVAERIPHDRVHADQPRRQMPDRKELHEFHVDQRGAGAQRQRIAVAAHIGRGAVAPVKPRQAAGRQHGRLGGDHDRRAGAEMVGDGAGDFAVADDEIDDAEIAGFADRRIARHRGAQRLRHRRPGIDEIDIDAARPVVARRRGRGDVAVLARPADAPAIQLADAVRRVLAQQLRQRLVAQPAAGGDGVGVMVLPSRPAFPRRARPPPSSAPSRWRRRARSGCDRRAAHARRSRAASIAAYMPAAPEPMTSTSVSMAMGSKFMLATLLRHGCACRGLRLHLSPEGRA